MSSFVSLFSSILVMFIMIISSPSLLCYYPSITLKLVNFCDCGSNHDLIHKHVECKKRSGQETLKKGWDEKELK